MPDLRVEELQRHAHNAGAPRGPHGAVGLQRGGDHGDFGLRGGGGGGGVAFAGGFDGALVVHAGLREVGDRYGHGLPGA